jgi:hypothetical protein
MRAVHLLIIALSDCVLVEVSPIGWCNVYED